MGAHEVFVFRTKLEFRQRVTAIESQDRQARLRAAAKPIQSLLQKRAVGIGEAVGRSKAMFGGYRLEVFDDDAVFFAPAQQNPAGFRAAMGRGRESFTDFLVDALHV